MTEKKLLGNLNDKTWVTDNEINVTFSNNSKNFFKCILSRIATEKEAQVNFEKIRTENNNSPERYNIYFLEINYYKK